ncbi:MAG: ABC transporter permease [Candidatus Polarisedimenticolia bacterium]
MLDALVQDVRYGLRTLMRNPGFALVAILTLALGIGANTAIVSVVNGVLLRPLPYHEPDQLVRLFTAFRGSGIERYAVSQPEFIDYKSLAHVFENAAVYTGATLTLTGEGEPAILRGMSASRDLFPVLGIQPMMGRNFEGDEGRTGVEPVAIVSNEAWRSRFGGDPALLGRPIMLNGVSRRVVGILPPGVTPYRAEIFIPFFVNPDPAQRANNFLSVVARLRPHVTIEAAQRELNALTRRLNEQYAHVYAESMGYGATIVSMHDEMVGEVRPALLVLLGAVGLVLLMGCANVANLLLARAEARQREMAVRLAMGAGRGRVVRQLLTESLLLSFLGAAGGALLCTWGLRLLLAVNPNAIPRVEEIGIDATVGVVTLVLAVMTGLLFGLAPALQTARGGLFATLKDEGRGATAGGRQQRVGRSLVVVQVALAVMVVVGAALLVRSFHALRAEDPGFDSRRMLTVDLSLPAARYDAAATTAFYANLLDRVRGLPGVQIAAAASELPPVSQGFNWDVDVEGRPLPPGQAAPSPNLRFVTRDYFRALSIPILGGRTFGGQDHASSVPVAIVNQTTARILWPQADPLGRRIRFTDDMPWITVVGVAGDTRSFGLNEPPPSEVFLLHEQVPAVAGGAERAMYVVLKTHGDPDALSGLARGAVTEADPLLAITGIRSMEELIDLSVARPRFTMLLFGSFGLLALTLAAVGIYGVMACAVRRRTREVGIRMALGARPMDILRLVVGQGMKLTLLGLAAGVAGACLGARLMAPLLYDVSAWDPLTFGGTVLLLACVALLASWLPARRAVITDPALVLRGD